MDTNLDIPEPESSGTLPSDNVTRGRYPESVAFVHDFLDSHGLDPYEFRIYCHIVRRTGGKPSGVCFASLEKIASTCKISERKTQEVLKFLVKARMITKHKNPKRRTDEYRVTLPQEWVPPGGLDELRRSLTSRKNKGNKNEVAQ